MMILTLMMISWSNEEGLEWTRMPSPGATIHQHGKPGLYGLLYHTTCIVVSLYIGPGIGLSECLQ